MEDVLRPSDPQTPIPSQQSPFPPTPSAIVLSGTMATGCRGASVSSRLSRPATPLSPNSSSMLYTMAICGLHWHWDVPGNLSQSTRFLRPTLMTLHSLTDEVMSTACRESFHLPSNGFLLFKYVLGFIFVVPEMWDLLLCR